MDFGNIYEIIENYARNTQTVESFYIGDAYMNFNSLHIDYAAFNVDINSVRRIEGFDVISFRFCYAGKLKNDSSNLFQIQSDGYNAVMNVIGHIKDEFEVDDYGDITITPFTQKFADILAGVWCDVNIYIPYDMCGNFDREESE